MVKYKSLLEKYCCSSVDGKENQFTVSNLKSKNMSEKQLQEESVMTKEGDPYVPSWRAACDAWVTKSVVEQPGVNTPVYKLYNAYIQDNPGDYMDIGQFGKVLRSRFPYRKRRRGKQGQQVYVYQDVALKDKQDSEETVGRLSQPTSEDNEYYGSVPGPSIVIANNAGGRLVSPPQTVRTAETYSPVSSPSKRQGSESNYQLSPTCKRLKMNDDNDNTVVPSGSAEHQNTGIDQQSEHEPLNLASEEEKYANSNLCRMAIGRRWIDTNLVSKTGTHTYANDICQAYAQDHPDEPLTFTSLALLIRGKYPGRRRKINVGSETRFLYQDITLIKSQSGQPQDDSNTPERRLSPLSLQPVPKKATDRYVPHNANQYALIQVTSTPTTATTNSSTKSHQNYYALNFVPAVMKVSSLPMGTQQNPMISGVTPNASSVGTSGIVLPTLQPTNVQSIIPDIERLLSGNDNVKKANYYESPHNKAVPHVKIHRGRTENKEKQVVKESVPEASRNSKGNKVTVERRPDMNVSEYLESELLDINEISKNVLNYEVSIQVPLGKQIEMSSGISNFPARTEVPIATEISVNKDRAYPTEYRTHVVPRTNKRAMGLSSVSEIKQLNYQAYDRLSMVSEDIASTTEEPIQENALDLRKCWDYGMRKSLSPGAENFVQTEDVYISKKKTKRNKYNDINKVPSTSFIDKPEVACSNMIYENENHNNLQGVPERRNSKDCKGNGGSPTSTAAPCAAMCRLAVEITTSTPHVSESSQQISAQSLPSTAAQEPRPNSPNIADPQLKKILRSILLTSRQILATSEGPLHEDFIHKKLEQAVITNNPAVCYDEPTTSGSSADAADSFPCSVMPDLKNLMLSSPEHVNNLIRHHQSCSGLGCSKDCQTLRAAYVHIAIFRHKCHVWNAFYKIFSKHSRPCRVVSCGVEFCHFVKHELHLNGVSVLPMQLLKERPTLEEEFNKCEEMGTHDGDLHCRHMVCPKLPSLKSKKVQLDSSDKQADDIMAMRNNMFPDTPLGNALAVPALQTLRLMWNLFQKTMEVG